MTPSTTIHDAVPLVTAGSKIACRVAVPEPYAACARYAIEALLVPLGLEPEFSGEPRILYGPVQEDFQGVRLAYAPEAAEFFGSGLRTYDSAQKQAFLHEGEEWPALFTASGGEPDLIASAFLFLSGWHEAASPERDEHGRVPFEATLPGVLDEEKRPMVDLYRSVLDRALAAGGVEVRPRQWDGRTWAFCSTHDIDYLRKGRPGIWYREVVQDFALNRRGASFGGRLSRLASFLRQMAAGDPYRDAFSRMILEVAERGATATYYLKTGAKDPHDVAYSLSGRSIRRRLEELSRRGFEIGLHPSYLSVDDPDMLLRERERLRAAVSGEPISVRQHYLRYDPLSTPDMHETAGFLIDSTIGFADRPGFRRGTCLPHRLFDLQGRRPVDVWEMPLTVMESALFNRRHMAVDEAVAVTVKLMEACRRHSGVCVALWHNTLWDELDCPGWGEHFTRTLDEAVSGGAFVASLENALRSWK